MQLERVANMLSDAAAAKQSRRMHRARADKNSFGVDTQSTLAGMLAAHLPFSSFSSKALDTRQRQQTAVGSQKAWDKSSSHRLARATAWAGGVLVPPWH